MKVEITLPRPFEAKTKYAERDCLLTITPAFSGNGCGQAPLGYIAVSGVAGRQRYYTLTVSGRSGKVTVNELSDTQCCFDSLTADQEVQENETES